MKKEMLNEKVEPLKNAEPEDDYEVEQAAQCLIRAEKVKQNDDLYAKAKAWLSEHKKSVDSASSGIDGLKKKRNEMAKKEN